MASREWKGFSEEELQLIKKQTSEPELSNVGLNDNQLGKRSKLESRKLKRPLTEKRLQLLEVKFDESSIKPEQRLSRSSSEGSGVLNVLDRNGEGRGQSTLIRVNSESQRYELLPSPTSDESKHIAPSPPPPPPPPSEALHTCHVTMQEAPNMQLVTVENSSVLSTEMTQSKLTDSNQEYRHISKVALEEFEQRQKHLEAENAKRKALLLKAIEDSKKRTLEESKKIVKIQSELAKLDFHLSSDVSILRSQIEEASIEYDKAQKRYERAEKEFVDAKLGLFQRMERKERLTEHLCTIIEQNEARKALKLGELMDQLGLENFFENCRNASSEITTLLPQLCALNDASLKAGQTLKPQANHNEEESSLHNNNITNKSNCIKYSGDIDLSASCQISDNL